MLAAFSVVLTLLTFPCAAHAASATGRLTLGVSERLRLESVDWFRPPADSAPAGAERYDFLGSMLRVGARLEFTRLALGLELQHTELVGLPDDASTPVSRVGNLGPGALYYAHTPRRSQGTLFLKQAHAGLKLPVRDGFLALSAGRFEVSDGLETIPADPALSWLKRARLGERLVGPFGYTHVTRSCDGFRLAYDSPGLNLTGFATRPTQGGFETDAGPRLEKMGLGGLCYTLKEVPFFGRAEVRTFYLAYRDGRDPARAVKVDNRPLDERRADGEAIRVHTWGAHAVAVAAAGPGQADALAWTAVQGGKWGALDHSAWAFALEGGYQLPGTPGKPWLRAGYGASSGDDDAADGTHRTFCQLLPTARMYALFPFYNLMNSRDLFAQLVLKPHPRLSLRSDLHRLRLAEPADLWYSGGGASNETVFGFAGLPSGESDDLATVWDLGLTATLSPKATATAYFGHAAGGEVVKRTFARASANFGFVELALRY